MEGGTRRAGRNLPTHRAPRLELRKTTLLDARATLDLVGRERFIGSVLLRPRKG